MAEPALSTPVRHPSFREAFRFWLKLGLISFGGPTGQIAIMHRELVEEKKWIGEERFLYALNFCMLLPGPEAQQLATYIGWLLHRTRGGIVAGVLFVLPSALLLWALSVIYVFWGNLGWIAAIFYGLKPAVVAIVFSAMIRIGKKALKGWGMWLIAIFSYLAIFAIKIPFPLIILGAAVLGYLGNRYWPDYFRSSKSPHSVSEESLRLDAVPPSRRYAARALLIGLALWWGPVLAAGLLLGWDHALTQEGLFFSKAAVVTFGGAYAVLPYVAQQAVNHFGWLQPGQMLDGLGLAETTPGPLVMVLQFVGFLGAWSHADSYSPLIMGTLGACMTTWVTFVPSILWIFLGAPYMERLRDQRWISAALGGVTAAVVGVICNLAIWFAWNVWLPQAGKIDWIALGISVIAFVGIQKWNWGIIPVVLGSGLAGIAVYLI